MDNQQNNQPTGMPPTMPTVEPPQAPVVSNTPPIQPKSSGSKIFLYVILSIVLLLLVAGGVYYYYMNSLNNSALTTTYPTPTVMPQTTATPTPTITPIQSSADLNGALNQIENTSPDSAGTELNANTTDSTTFSE